MIHKGNVNGNPDCTIIQFGGSICISQAYTNNNEVLIFLRNLPVPQDPNTKVTIDTKELPKPEVLMAINSEKTIDAMMKHLRKAKKYLKANKTGLAIDSTKPH